MECPLCGEEYSPAYTPSIWGNEKEFGLFHHIEQCSGRLNGLSAIRCVCGHVALATASYRAQCFLARDHLSRLSPEEHRRHRVLWEMGLRVEAIDE